MGSDSSVLNVADDNLFASREKVVVRNDWKLEEVALIYNEPLLKLVLRAANIHSAVQDFGAVQKCTLLSVKTGGCPEDCAYCPQSARYSTNVESTALMALEDVVTAAQDAKASGSTRFCMGAAWREVKDNEQFDSILDMVKAVSAMNMEVCCTLGMLSESQAERLKNAGLTAYNHNLDSSKDFYSEIISTRTYEDRLKTLSAVRQAGLSVCCGGIVGMGESAQDRISMLQTLSNLSQHPESVPINALVPVSGTPLAGAPPVDFWILLRTIACARILMPKSMVRLSAGRLELSQAQQALCFLSGANSIFTGEKLLTTDNCELEADEELFMQLGLVPMPSHQTVC